MALYEPGTTNFIVSVVDGSSNPISGYANNLDIVFIENGESVSKSYTVTEVSGQPGWYNIETDLSPSTAGGMVISTTGSYLISPEVYDFQIPQVGLTEINQSLLSQATLITDNTPFGSIIVNGIEGDDLDFDVIVPSNFLPLTSYTNWKLEFRTVDNFSTTVPNITGCVVTVTDPTSGQINFTVPSTSTASIVTNAGLSEQLYYGDIQALDGNSKKKTVIRVSLNLLREFTYG